MVAHALSVAHTPMGPCAPMISLAMTNLRAKLERRSSGEVDCITIEHCRERRCNLDGDFDAANSTPVMQVAHTPIFLGSGGGCMALAPTPLNGGLEKYDGSINPTEFLQVYTTSILAARGNEPIMANYFPVALTSTTRSWLMNLPPGSLTSWEELCHQFTTNFKSAYTRPDNEVDLHTVQQRLGESL
jgi:hypothetical protein